VLEFSGSEAIIILMYNPAEKRRAILLPDGISVLQRPHFGRLRRVADIVAGPPLDIVWVRLSKLPYAEDICFETNHIQMIWHGVSKMCWFVSLGESFLVRCTILATISYVLEQLALTEIFVGRTHVMENIELVRTLD